VLETYRVIGVVGLSPNPDRPSHGVAGYLQREGYTIVPIHPTATEILGQTAYPDLRSVPPETGIEVVQVFRKPEFALEHAQEAIDIGAKVLWMQEGVVNPEAAKLASDAGLTVIMDRCMAQDHSAFNR
jgi:predicted CoA-binding protein